MTLYSLPINHSISLILKSLPKNFNHLISQSAYCQTSNIRCTLVGNKIVDHADVVGASPVGSAPTTSSFSSEHMASMDWAKTTARLDEKTFGFGDLVCLILEVWWYSAAGSACLWNKTVNWHLINSNSLVPTNAHILSLPLKSLQIIYVQDEW